MWWHYDISIEPRYIVAVLPSPSLTLYRTLDESCVHFFNFNPTDTAKLADLLYLISYVMHIYATILPSATA
jgi:hypothetical protein